MADRLPSTFTLWLEEALTGWILPVAAVVTIGGVGLLYLAGIASEEVTATLVVLAAGIASALYVVRPALDARRTAGGRALAGAAAVATLAVAVVPALRTVHPGAPLFAGDLEQVGDAVAVPEGVSGPVRLLVSGRLAERGEPTATFELRGTEVPVEGRLERTFSTARVGRSGRARVAHDHTADYYAARLPPGTRAVSASRLGGQLGSALHVAAYRPPIQLPGGPWLLAALALLLGALADARLGLRNQLAVAAGMASAFGLLVTYNATPAAAVGPSVGGIVLGALAGSLAGWIAGAVVRRLVPAEVRPSRNKGGAAVA